MNDDPFFCDDCGEELGHDDIQTAADVPQLDVESFEMGRETVDVHQCSGCGMVLGFSQQ
ncbi:MULTISPECIES: hypothetical protein [Salinibaculum]|uniref:hypothetical protein n=1 Tax=Salinibaculum TaxID=2732368 RepID=UPI0030D5118D